MANKRELNKRTNLIIFVLEKDSSKVAECYFVAC